MKKSLFHLHIAIILASLSAIFGKLITLNEVFLTFYRMFFAAVILLILEWMVKKYKPQRADNSYVWVEDRARIMGVGMLLALHWIFFYASIKYANIAVGVVCFCLTSLFTALLAPLLQKKPFSWSEIGISLLTLLGILLIFKFESQFRLGIVLGVLSSLFVALFTILNEPWSKYVEAQRLTKYHMIGGTVGMAILLPIYLKIEPVAYSIPKGLDLVYLILLSSFCTVLLYILLNKAMRYLSAFTVNINFNLEPLYAIAIAAVFFQEFKEVSAAFFVGLLLILAALLLQLLQVLRKRLPN